MINREKTQTLSDEQLFLTSLPESCQQRLYSLGQVRQVQAGEVLIEEGSTEPILLFLQKGICQVRKLTSERGLGQFREVTLRHTLPPALFGEMFFFEHGIHSTSVVTTVPSQIWELKGKAFSALLDSDANLRMSLKHILGSAVAKRLCETEAALSAKLVSEALAYLNRNETTNETTIDEAVNWEIIDYLRTDSFSRYPDAFSEELLTLLSEYTGVPPSWLMVCPGSALGLDYIARTYTNSNTTVTILSPTFKVFPHCVKLQKANIDSYFYPDPFQVDIENFLDNTNPNSDVIYISNPGNPTGIYHTPSEISTIAAARSHSLLVIDEAYIEFGGESVLELLQQNSQQFLITRTLSKAFGMAGLRIGYLIGHPERLASIKQFCIPYSTSRIAQVAARSVLRQPQHIITKTNKICEQREYLVSALRDLGYRIEAGPTNFILLFVSDAKKAVSFFRRYDILLSNASSAYLGQCLRISLDGDLRSIHKVLDVAKKWQEIFD